MIEKNESGGGGGRLIISKTPYYTEPHKKSLRNWKDQEVAFVSIEGDYPLQKTF
jgi:hypothetical protein